MVRRAANGAGSVWQRPDGRWNAALTYPYHDDTGKVRRKRITTTKRDWASADKWLTQKKHDLLSGVPERGEDPYVSDYLLSWLAESVEPRVAPRTHEKRRYCVTRHIIPTLGRTKLSELSPRQVQSLYSGLARAGYSFATRREVHVTLRMALERAAKWSTIPRNPCDLVDPPQETKAFTEDEEEVRALSDAQAMKLFSGERDSRWCNYWIVAVRTGLRPGEMLGLRWGDLALEGDPGSLKVRRTLDTHSTARFGPPKSEASRRTVMLHWEAQEALLAQKEMLESEDLATTQKALVFPSTTGSPMSSNNLNKRYLKPALKRSDLPQMTLHELRHTFASIWLHEWMVPPSIVSEMMGHDSIMFTMNLYGHLLPTAQEDAIRKLRQLQKSPESAPSEIQ